MNIQKLNDWLQLIAALGVIAGLVLVVWELRQDRLLTRAELGADSVSGYVSIYAMGQQETTARVFAKAAMQPTELTVDEHVVMESFFRAVIDEVVGREVYLKQRGVFPHTEVGFHDFLVRNILFSTEYGRAWWAVNKDTLQQRHREGIERAIEVGDSPLFVDRMRALEDRLRRVDR